MEASSLLALFPCGVLFLATGLEMAVRTLRLSVCAFYMCTYVKKWAGSCVRGCRGGRLGAWTCLSVSVGLSTGRSCVSSNAAAGMT